MKNGDIVYLNSGSPPMQVQSILDGDHPAAGTVMVTYADETGEIVRQGFPKECLTADRPDHQMITDDANPDVISFHGKLSPGESYQQGEYTVTRAEAAQNGWPVALKQKPLDELVGLITQWGRDRNIIGGATSKDQLPKLMSEIGELADKGIAKRDMAEIKDGLGDAFVVLCMIAGIEGVSMAECIQGAYLEIAPRKGVLFDGVFVKESDPQFAEVHAKIEDRRASALAAERDRDAGPLSLNQMFGDGMTLHDHLSGDPAHAPMQQCDGYDYDPSRPGANIHGIGPDVASGSNPDYRPEDGAAERAS